MIRKPETDLETMEDVDVRFNSRRPEQEIENE